MENNQIPEEGYQEENLAVQKSKDEPSTSGKIASFLSILERAINDWRKNLRKFVEIYLWGIYYSLIPLAVGMVFIFLSRTTDLTLIKAVAAITSFVAIVVLIYFFIQAYVGMFIFLKKDFQGSAKESFKEARPFIWPYFWLALLTGVLILLWALLLIIPGVIFSVYYSFAVYVFFFEEKKGMEAIKRSKQLVKGYWWPVAGRILGFSLLVWLFMMLVSIPGMMAVEDSWFWNFWNVITEIISYLIGPIAMLFSYTIYKDLVNIKK